MFFRRNWQKICCSLQDWPTLLSQFLSTKSGKSRLSRCQYFSVNFIKGPHSVTKLPVMGWHFTVKHSLSVKGWLLFQWRVDWHFTVNSSPTVQGPHFAVKLFWWRDDTLLSDSFSEGMTLCCQTISVKGWHFAVKLFQSRDDTLLSDSFSEGMTFCCQTLSVKGWHFAVRLFQWRDDTLLSNSLSKGMTLCCQSFSSSNKPIDILLPNFLFHWRVNWHCCHTLFHWNLIDTQLPNILFQWRADWHSAVKHSLSKKGWLAVWCDFLPSQWRDHTAVKFTLSANGWLALNCHTVSSAKYWTLCCHFFWFSSFQCKGGRFAEYLSLSL